ncbi:hypothetical protein K4K57_010848 [Colletotrichum sp. SAR 10_99]|nr:hypothetical protein K4K57_010848 [Colletotrichum sp. SAR 10_99]
MAPALHLFLTLLLASLTTARLPIFATPDPLIKSMANTNPPAWLSPQACHPRSNFPSAPPVNATDSREDAKRFCARAAELVPVMRPKQVLRGNGLGGYSEQHFQLEFLDPCPHRNIKAQGKTRRIRWAMGYWSRGRAGVWSCWLGIGTGAKLGGRWVWGG